MRGKGGGPKTENGKAAVRKNAVKHGLRAITPVVKDVEVPEIWEAHREGMFESLQPDGYHERELARRIAELLWRLRRVSLHETELINSSMNRIGDDWVEEAALGQYREKVLGIKTEPLTIESIDRRIGIRMLPSPNNIARIARYESHLHRMYIQTLHELEALQARRNGERVPLTRLDISGPPAG